MIATPMMIARMVMSVSKNGKGFVSRISMAHVIVKINKFLQKQVIDEVDVFVVCQVHVVSLLMIMYSVIRGALQA
jgi:hypothetical protein